MLTIMFVTVRVLYSSKRLTKIASVAAEGESIFSQDDRIGLVNDAAALAKAGFIPASAALAVADRLRGETRQHVWDTIGAFANSVRGVWYEHEKVVDGMAKFQRSLFTPLVEKLGYEFPKGEDLEKSLLRKTAISGAISGRDQKCVAQQVHGDEC
jgi:aminopeptidase 2